MRLFSYPLLSDTDAVSASSSELHAQDYHEGSLLSFHQNCVYFGLCVKVRLESELPSGDSTCVRCVFSVRAHFLVAQM